MTDNEKKMTPAEMKELTDEQTGDAAGGMSKSEALRELKKQNQSQEQKQLISDLAGMMGDVGSKIGRSFIKPSAVPLGAAKEEGE